MANSTNINGGEKRNENQKQSDIKDRKFFCWIRSHPAEISLIASLLALGRVMGIANLFTKPEDWKRMIESEGFSMVLSLPDIPALFLAGFAIMLGWKTMKRNRGLSKRGKGGFLIGILCLIISITPIGDAITLMSMSFPVWIRGVYYGITGQEDKMAEIGQAMDGGKEIILTEKDYSIDAHVDKTFNPAFGTEWKVKGTLTNKTEKEWTSVEILVSAVDENGETKKIQSYNKTFALKATISYIPPGETVQFETEKYPGILESDYEGLVDYRIDKIWYWEEFEDE